MRIAIIGAGLAGLSTAWFLLEQGVEEVVLFDGQGVGGGASGIAAGLLHPYVGEEGKRSLFASEALQSAGELIGRVQEGQETPLALPGIERFCIHAEQEALFLEHGVTYGDVEPLGGNRFLIRSGWTVDCPAYLRGLAQGILSRGGRFVQQAIASLEELQGFDQVVVAAGAGVQALIGSLSLAVSLVKGQVLLCEAEGEEAPAQSRIGKGYVARVGDSRSLCVGSTYERQWRDAEPDLEKVSADLLSKAELFCPGARRWKVTGCRAALRVIRRGHYFPIVAQEREGVWLFTALGSRGLLYHALLGKKLAEAVVHRDAARLYPYAKDGFKR